MSAACLDSEKLKKKRVKTTYDTISQKVEFFVIERNIAIMLWLIFCFTALSTGKCDSGIEAKTLTAFVRQFRVLQPLPIFHNATKQTKINLIKSTSKQHLSMDWIDKLHYSEKFLLVICQSDILLDEIEEIKIDQQIYFLTSSSDLYEMYTVNNKIIKQKLGHFAGSSYIPEESVEQNFLKRRHNFYGSNLIALVGDVGNYITIENLKSAPYFPSNGTFDVTGLVQGPIFDIWMTLQNRLNFTTKMYTRKDKKWGVPIQHSNGSISVPDGTIKDVMVGSADTFLTSLAITYNRYLVIDYLVPLVSFSNGIFIKKDSIQESLDFEVFQKPFDKWTWTTLFSSSLMVTISIVFISKALNQENLSCINSMNIFTKSLQANLGSASFISINNKFHSIQLVTFVSLITGNIIWIAYNGALLSKLVEPRFDKPFYDLDSLAKTNYR